MKIANVPLMLCVRVDCLNKQITNLFHPVYLPEMDAVALSVLNSGMIASGLHVATLEKEFSNVACRNHIVSTSNLTSAMQLALHLAGIREGDEVATVSFTSLQSSSPIVRLGARPVWIDIDPATMSIDLSLDRLGFWGLSNIPNG